MRGFLMKKIMTLLAALAVALMFAGCADLAGTGSATGLKTNKTVNVDATATAKIPLEKNYRRCIKQLGNSEKVSEITTTITFKEEDCIFDGEEINNETSHAVIGYVFDLNKSPNKPKDTSTERWRDFYVFGFCPSTKKAYIEHYYDVNFKDELDVNEGTVGSRDDEMLGDGGWSAVSDSYYTVQEVNQKKVYTLVVTVKQDTAGQYTFELGGHQIGKASKASVSKCHDESTGLNIGGVAAYVNCPKGTKVKANFKTEQSSVTGTFFAEEDEE